MRLPKDLATLRQTYSFNSANVLTVDSNPKLSKDVKTKENLTVHIAGHHFLPVAYNACPSASKACMACCLNTAGNPAYMSNKIARRGLRSKAFNQSPKEYMRLLVLEVARFVYKKSKGIYNPTERFAIRLNATSDYKFEALPVVVDVELAEYIGEVFDLCLVPGKYNNIMEVFKKSPLKILTRNVVFYDYTKRIDRDLETCRKVGYDLSISWGSKHDVIKYAKANNLNIAAPMSLKKSEPIPTELLGFPTVDGDQHDARFLDNKSVPHIVVLRWKRAKNETPELKKAFCIA